MATFKGQGVHMSTLRSVPGCLATILTLGAPQFRQLFSDRSLIGLRHQLPISTVLPLAHAPFGCRVKLEGFTETVRWGLGRKSQYGSTVKRLPMYTCDVEPEILPELAMILMTFGPHAWQKGKSQSTSASYGPTNCHFYFATLFQKSLNAPLHRAMRSPRAI